MLIVKLMKFGVVWYILFEMTAKPVLLVELVSSWTLTLIIRVNTIFHIIGNTANIYTTRLRWNFSHSS